MDSTRKEELSDDDLMDTCMVMQRRFYLPRGKREAIEKTTSRNTASTSPSAENAALSQSSTSGSGRTTRPRRVMKRQAGANEIALLFKGVDPVVFSRPKTKKRTKEAISEEHAEVSSSKGHSTACGSTAEHDEPEQNDTPHHSRARAMVTPTTSRRNSGPRMVLVLTQVDSVMSKLNHEGYQVILGNAIPAGEMPKWVSNDMNIRDEEIENAYTKFTEAISVDTAGKRSFLYMFANMIDSIGKLGKASSENETDKRKKTRRSKKSGNNQYLDTDAGCHGDEDDDEDESMDELMEGETIDRQGNLEGFIKDPLDGDSDSDRSGQSNSDGESDRSKGRQELGKQQG